MSKYKNKTKIGSGGFGHVWRCVRKSDNQVYAKKTLQEDVNEDAIKRFKREVRILSMLDHPNVIHVVSKELQNVPFSYVMPLYDRSLKEDINSIKANDKQIYSIFLAILNAVEYAHSQGVIHRDLKPENVLINQNEIVVTDFGLGRILDSESTRQTITGYGMGTFFYMAPEQFNQAKNADERSDIFSLGRILYELYTGPLTSIGQDTSSLPSGITLIIDRCTKDDPSKRFQSISDFKNTWINIFDTAQKESEIDELQLLCAKLSAPSSQNRDKVERLLKLLLKYQEDTDLLHESLMQVDSSAVQMMYDIDSSAVEHLIGSLCKFFTSQGWPFSYTDKIGDKCKSLFYAINDPQIRASLVSCTMEVGARHNRWYVLGIFRELLESGNDGQEVVVLAQQLEEIDKRLREKSVEYLDMKNINQLIRPYFEFDEPEDSGDTDIDLPF